MIPRILIDACKDPRISSPHVMMLVYLNSLLNHVEPRPIKHWYIARELRVSRNWVGMVIKRLVECGYLREGPRQTRNVATYMLLPAWGTGLTADTKAANDTSIAA